jgi:ribosomal protein L37E
VPGDQTSLQDLVNRIRFGRPATVYIGVYRCDARFAVPEGESIIYGFLGPHGREFSVIQTRFDDVDGVHVPRELMIFCLAIAADRETAHPYLYQIASQVLAAGQLSANAGSTVLRETYFSEFPFGKWTRFYREVPFEDIPRFPLGGRILDREHTLHMASRIWGSPERERLLLAINQYQEALRTWRQGSAPLLCIHLWMAVEALTDAVLRRELALRGCTELELMDAWNIPLDQHATCDNCAAYHAEVTTCEACGHTQLPRRNDRKYHLLARVRREVIFRGDAATYKAIHTLSNRIEHGSATFQEIWATPFANYERTGRYIREVIFDLIDLEAADRDVLGYAPYSTVYLPPDPPIHQDFISTPRPVPYQIPPPQPFDWYALNFKPKPKAVVLSADGLEYSVEY